MNHLHEISARSKDAFFELSVADASLRNAALINMADVLNSRAEQIFSANRQDIDDAEKNALSAPLLQRLKFGSEKLSQVSLGLKELASLPDPLGKTTYANQITDGLSVYRVVCPIGVIGVIFESRPDALVQIASLCIKSGNSVLLKGGREALHTNRVLCECIRDALRITGLPENAVQQLESREEVADMLKEDEFIDLIIPRGSKSFVRYIMDNSRIPVLGHADGICHVYVDECADPSMAVRIVTDSKTQNVSVCNAAETLLIHRNIAGSILPAIAQSLRARGVMLRGDSETCRIIECDKAEESDWSTEYLDYILSIRIVSSLLEAVDHINHYGSHHTDCIVTDNRENAAEFMNRVDSAGVYWNTSTRFADGFVYGFGAEVGIATGKIHARGPMGLEGLTTYKYKMIGSGHILSEMKDGTRQYSHRALNQNCPL